MNLYDQTERINYPMSIEQPTEEILLESEDDVSLGPSEESFARVTAQLLQVQKWKRVGLGTRILDNRFLFVKQYHNRKTATYWVDLLFMDPQPQRDRFVDWRWGLWALGLLALAGGLLALEYYFQLSAKFGYFNSIAVLLATLAVLCVLSMIYTSRNAVLFHTHHGRVPILALAYNNPSKEAFQTYIETLKLCIEQVQAQHAHKSANRLASELAEHRRLKDEKAISESAYEAAKNRILSQH